MQFSITDYGWQFLVDLSVSKVDIYKNRLYSAVVYIYFTILEFLPGHGQRMTAAVAE